MTSTLPPASLSGRRQSLVNQVLDYLQQQIVSGAFSVGSKLPAESELMAHLTVGRSTVREAMQVLAHMGLVEVRAGDGTYVCAPQPETEPLGQRLRRAKIFEVYEVRHTLELECARLAAQRRDEQDLARIQQAVQQRREFLATRQEQAFIDADLAFHSAIADASKNTVLADLYHAFITVHRETWTQASEIPGLSEQGQIVHEQIAEAIEQCDPQRAQHLVERLLSESTDRFRQLLHNEE